MDQPRNYTPLRISVISERQSRRKFRMLILATVAVVSLVSFIATNRSAQTTQTNAQTTTAEKSISPKKPSPTGSPLQNKLDNVLKAAPGIYAVAITQLDTDEQYFFKETRVFGAASLYKLFIMAMAFEKINDGSLKEYEVMKDEIPKLNEKFKIATDEAELTEGTVSMTVAEALKNMITVSDNYSALLLSDRIGLAKSKEFLNRHGFFDTALTSPPQTTARDITRFFEKLYRGELADEEYSHRMLALLKGQQLVDILPKYLPDEVEVAHKTGQLQALAHDAGIVYTDSGDYSIVLLSETDNPIAAKEFMAEISEAVYNYFTRDSEQKL